MSAPIAPEPNASAPAQGGCERLSGCWKSHDAVEKHRAGFCGCRFLLD